MQRHRCTQLSVFRREEGNLPLRRPPCEHLSEYLPMDPGHKAARKDHSDNADLHIQAIGPAVYYPAQRRGTVSSEMLFPG